MFIMLIIIVCELLFTKSCLMTCVAHSETDFCTVLFYSLRDVRLEQPVDTNCCLRERVVINE